MAAAIVAYVAGLQFMNIDYRVATALFVSLVGGYLARHQTQLWPAVLVTAAMLSLGLHFLFTQVLVVDLP